MPYYMVAGTPSPDASATSYGPMVGGGFADIASGLITITASVGGAAYGTLGLPVRADAFTIVDADAVAVAVTGHSSSGGRKNRKDAAPEDEPVDLRATGDALSIGVKVRQAP